MISPENTKKCANCGLWFELDDFYRDRSTKDGLTRSCKGCQLAKATDYYYANRETILAKSNARNRGRAGTRVCRLCERQTWDPKSPYCEEHAQEALERRVQRRSRSAMTPLQLAKAKERERKRRRYRPWHGIRYGGHHHKERAAWKVQVATGTVLCAECGNLIRPGEPWDLGHVPGGGPHDYRGPEHARCNRATAKKRLPRGLDHRQRQIFVSRVL